VPELGSGKLVASAGGHRLELAGGNSLRVRNDSAATGSYTCQWLHELTPGETKSAIGDAMAGETTAVIVSDAAESPMVRCRLSDGETGAVTEVLIGLDRNDRYSGYAISHGPQS
jgi:uncharacterized protein YodC (DUF2158 family)